MKETEELMNNQRTQELEASNQMIRDTKKLLEDMGDTLEGIHHHFEQQLTDPTPKALREANKLSKLVGAAKMTLTNHLNNVFASVESTIERERGRGNGW